ncbi:uncharacterized protein C2orf72 homolog isoform X2 [Heterocephalus glaber]|uniref:Uncharacterized protein C2orf72 homolog isoform X2 n=1 Tax=Heterocephalus glaber TaxID=10181 RepID=A0AAX6S2S7_HETGA|nr:uncharacterized protein C2orf72 homolog isoform X2 [Heterocephalus glaber]
MLPGPPGRRGAGRAGREGTAPQPPRPSTPFSRFLARQAGAGGGGGRAASMQREPEPVGPAEPRFRALVEAAGGRGQVLLVGELWEREQSRALLRDFARALFPPESTAGKPEAASAEAAGSGARGTRDLRAPLVFVLCRAASLAAREPQRCLRELLRDVRGRLRAGAALVGVLVAEAGPEDAAAPGLRLLEALLRAVFGRRAGGTVQAAAYCPGRPASCLAVQAAACRALQAAGCGRPEGAWERPGLLGLLTCFSWGPWGHRKERDSAFSQDTSSSPRGSPQETLQDSEEELALTTIFPNGDCEDRAQAGAAHPSPVPTGDSR